MAALRFLKLIDDEGNADPDLRRMAEDATLRKSILFTRLADAYGPAINGLDLSAITLQQLKERFRENYGVNAATFEKAVSLLPSSCASSGYAALVLHRSQDKAAISDEESKTQATPNGLRALDGPHPLNPPNHCRE